MRAANVRRMAVGLALLGLMAFGGTAKAGSIFQNEHYDFSFAPGASSFQEYMGFDFDPFDEQGGTRTLETVMISFNIIASAHVTVENDSEYFMDTVIVKTTVHLDIDSLVIFTDPMKFYTIGGTAADMYSDEATWLDPSDGVSGSGSDFHDFGILSPEAFGFWDSITDPSHLDKFIGIPIQLVFDGSAEFALGGETWTPLIDVSNPSASMNVSLTYEYSVVPEPGSIALLLCGLLAGLIRWRRWR